MREPKQLKVKLAGDRNLRSAVDALIVDFEPWFRNSNLPFFPDYTDHGINHVEDVLTSAASLVSDAAWGSVTAQDAGMLIIAALLHDCALHLTEDGFIALVTGQTKHTGVKEFDSKSWPELWNDFLFSAMRYDDRTIEAIFGQPVTMRRPPFNPGEMTQQDRKLIGEFIRRHHGRLAHEIALAGVPSPSGESITLSHRLDADLADLAGLIARSHSISLRSTFKYLGDNFHLRSYQDVHAVYLMVLLRIADYLQIQSERAPHQVLKVKRILSPISRQEWNAHGAIVNIVPNDVDPESIFIQAKPGDVKTYLRLKEWLEGIQDELDTSWAVLGEVYAPIPSLKNLGLVLRRVSSNLDDEEKFARQAPFVPKRVEFDIARAETLKLLIRPLYGDRPEIGIRELVQNAVDAVRELWDLQEQRPELRNKPLIEQEADVVVWVDEPGDDGLACVTISDRGVGMTENIIREYFLKAGASFRFSDAWARQHEQVDHDDELGTQRKSRILRTGRFGIGVLAAFLLGDYLEVETRHVTSESGLRFTTSLEPDVIELRRDDTLQIGTTIRIPISKKVYEHLAGGDHLRGSWDWYCLNKPSVLRLVGHKRKSLHQRLIIPDVNSPLSLDWHMMDHPDFERVHWSYSLPAEITCNGIYVQGLNIDTVHGIGGVVGDPLFLRTPFVSVFDPNGNLPLDLTRSKVDTENTRLFPDLVDVSGRYLLAYLLTSAPTKYELQPSPKIPYFLEKTSRFRAGPWFYTKEGTSILDGGNILYAKIRSFLILQSFRELDAHFLAENPVEFYEPLFRPPTRGHDGLFFIDFPASSDHSFLVRNTEFVVASLLNFDPRSNGRRFKGFDRYSSFRTTHFSNFLSTLGFRILVPGDIARAVLDNITDRSNWGFIATNDVELEWENGTLALLRIGNCPSTLFDLEVLDKWHSEHRMDELTSRPISGLAAEWFFEPRPGALDGSALTTLFHSWREIIGHAIIPYDLRQRRKKLAKAYKVLEDYIRDFE